MKAFSSLRQVSALAIVALALAVACSEQDEGERCDTKSGNDDCEGGLVCVSHEDLLRGREDETDRCCPPDDETPSDDRCRRAMPALSPPGNPSVAGGTGGGAGADAGGAGGLSGGGNPDQGSAGDPSEGGSSGRPGSESAGTAGQGGIDSTAGAAATSGASSGS